MSQSVVVFCSASDKVSPLLFSEMELLGKTLAESQVEVIFGGSNKGLMKCLADSVLKYKGKITGVIPKYMDDMGISHPNLTKLEVVADLLDRKRRMLEIADAVICFPGGVGTLDEITEVMALKQLKEIDKKVVFINFLDFWNPFFELLEELKERHMISQDLGEIFKVCDSSEQIMEYL